MLRNTRAVLRAGFDFVLAMARHLADRAARAAARRKKSPAMPPVQQGAEERWDADAVSVAWRTESALPEAPQSSSIVARGGNVRETRD